MVLVPEWLSGITRNHVGSARGGSNPAEHALSFALSVFVLIFKYRRGTFFGLMSSLRVDTTVSSKSESIHNTYLITKISLQLLRSKLSKFLIS